MPKPSRCLSADNQVGYQVPEAQRAHARFRCNESGTTQLRAAPPCPGGGEPPALKAEGAVVGEAPAALEQDEPVKRLENVLRGLQMGNRKAESSSVFTARRVPACVCCNPHWQNMR